MSIISRKYLIAGMAIAALTFATSLSLTHTAQAATCKQTMVQSSGIGGSKASALKNAWNNWQKKVTTQFGLNWSVPQYATSKSESCHHLKCTVKAQPCYHFPQ